MTEKKKKMNALEAALNSVFARCVYYFVFAAVVILAAPVCALLLLCLTCVKPRAAVHIDTAAVRFVWDQSLRELVKYYSPKRTG